MLKVGEFEKVSFPQFLDAMTNTFGEHAHGDVNSIYSRITLPSRATSGSAGYDFRSPVGFQLKPGQSIKIPTGIRVKIDTGWWLGCFPRSGMGFRYRLQLDNTVGIIDSDYYYSDNEGHIFVQITNDGTENRVLDVQAGDKFVQAIFIPYGITYSDDANAVRNGGMGSTDTKEAE